MGKVIDTTSNVSSYDLISQTPPNYNKDNSFLHSLQDKVNADWDYRPNRVDVEQELHAGQDDFTPMEVVIQSIRNDKGEKVSNDVCRVVFRNIRYECRLGTKFRFSYNFDLEEPPEKKDVWLATNKDSITPTSSVVLTRCNGTIGSIYMDAQGRSQYHYEPIICTTDLRGANFHYNDVIITPQAEVIIIAQHNQYTRQYTVNQRFVLGYDKVYKVKAINKFNSLTTYDPQNVDTIMLYAEVDEISAYDNFETRIAYNHANVPPVVTPPVVTGDFTFSVTEPTPLPTELFSTPIQFSAYLTDGAEVVDVPITVSVTLEGTTMPDNYYELTQLNANQFTLRRKKLYNRSLLEVKCFVAAEDSPTGEEFAQTFSLSLRGLE